MKARPVQIAFLVLFFLLTVLKPANAVSISITSFPSTITYQPFTIEASISGATTATNYLRIDLYRDGTSNYFGETFNGSDWYNGSTYSLYLPISIKTGIIWQGSIMGSVGSPTSGEFDGNGDYKMRVRRYTSGGTSNATEANNSAVTVAISMPTATPTPSPTPETPTDTPTPTLKNNPTNTPIPKKTPTPTPKKTPTPTPKSSKASTASGKTSPTETPTQASVLGQSTNSNDSEKSNQNLTKSVLSSNSENLLPKLTIIIGGIFLVLCAIFVAYPIIKEKLDEKRNLQN